MTVVKHNNDILVSKFNHRGTQKAILNNFKIEDKLNVIGVISNPCNYKKRLSLANKFIKHMEEFDNVNLYIVELIYNKYNQGFSITSSKNPNHLQIKTDVPLWHKESMCNQGVKYLLPKDWKAFAWIDMDIEFDNLSWVDDTLKILNGYKDVVQLFSHCLDMDNNENTMQVFHSFGYQYDTGKKYCNTGVNYWHPGYAYAMTRKAYEKIGGLYEESILGSGDHNMALGFLGNKDSINMNTTDGYKKSVENFVKKAQNLRLGYVPGIIRHYFHGTKENRKYNERWQILVKHKYDPSIHITRDKLGIIIPTKECPKGLLDDILQYFKERKEDD